MNDNMVIPSGDSGLEWKRRQPCTAVLTVNRLGLATLAMGQPNKK
jgi:hypothetical protein